MSDARRSALVSSSPPAGGSIAAAAPVTSSNNNNGSGGGAAAAAAAARPQRFGPYHVGETIGRGTFAKVKIAVHESSKSRVALKIIPRKFMDADSHSAVKIRREITIMRVLRHPHITRLYDVVQTKHDIVLVLEYVSGGELFRYINRRGRLAETQARALFQQLAAAVAYCHRLRVTHRDIKPENILLDGHTLSVKLSDFGLSSITHDGRFFNTSCGTPNYASPEVVCGLLYGGPETDVWSCGVVLYAMLCGKLPFDEDDVAVLFRKIRTADFVVPPYVSSEARDLLHRMLVVDSLRRATMEQVMQHPWLRPTYPRYLLSLHYAAVLESMRFARDRDVDASMTPMTTLSTTTTTAAAMCSSSSSNVVAACSSLASLDVGVVEALATRFRLTPAQVAACVRTEEQRVPSMFAVLSERHPGAVRRYPAAVYFEAHSSVLDSKLWPTPLEIALAEVALRDEAHDVYVSYCILTSKKQSRQCIDDAHVDRSLNASASSFLLSQSAQGYGSLNAHSLYQVSGNGSFAGMRGAAADKAAANAATGGGGVGALLTKTRHMDEHMLSQLPATSSATAEASRAGGGGAAAGAAEVVDEWMYGYNRVAQPFLPLRCAPSQHTLLGRRLRVCELRVATLLERHVAVRPRPRDAVVHGRRRSGSCSSSSSSSSSADDSDASRSHSRSSSGQRGRVCRRSVEASTTAAAAAAGMAPASSSSSSSSGAAAAAALPMSGSLLRPVARGGKGARHDYGSRHAHGRAGGAGAGGGGAVVYGAAPPPISRLLRPLGSREVREATCGGGGAVVARARGRGSVAEQQQQQPSSSPALLYEVVDALRFGNDFLRNGVAFAPSTLPTTLAHLYACLREEGLLWRPIYHFCLACVRYPDVKLQVKMYKLTPQMQVVDVKVSVQSGMAGCDAAVSLLERLRRKAATMQQQQQQQQLT